ncbi:MAG: M50 family metallopeptidase [Lactobacillales bacterium]|jgi:regulator of sigma E protease|nr:M50 family metallopeptidase [Lactobacillales bacterium]
MFFPLIYLFAFIFVLSIVVIVHEGGHFFVARWCGVKVTDFSLGFGKTLWSRKDKKGTTWRVCAVPLGGYVKMLGDEDAASAKSSAAGVSASDKKYTFAAQPLWKRASIIFAGPAMNYIFAVLLFAGVLWVVGDVKVPAVVGEVLAESAAEEAGIRPEDKIVEINGQPIVEYRDVQRAVRLTEYGKTLSIVLNRGGELVGVIVTPKYDAESEVPKIGIMSSAKLVVVNDDLNAWEALKISVRDVYRMTADTLIYLKQILFEKRSARDMRGPLGIAEASGDAFQGGVLSLLVFIVQISVAIGLMNLLPIPILDGGHLAIYLVEAIIRRPISEKVKNGLLWFGLSLLLLLFAYTFFLDIPRIVQRIFG